MKYLMLTEYFPSSESAEITGGVENRYFYLAKELAKEHNVFIICSRQKGQKKYSTVFGAKVIRCGPINPYSNKGSILGRLRFVINAYLYGIKLKDVSKVEGASFLTYVPAYFIGKSLKAEKVATWHETWVGEWIKNKGLVTGLTGTIWECLALKLKWDKVISVSEFTKRRLLKRKIRCKKIDVVPNGINLAKIKRLKTKKFAEPTICVVGRLTKSKNVGLVVKAVKHLKSEFPNILLKIVGDGPELNNLVNLAKKLGLEKNVKFLGFLPTHDEVLKTLKSSHVYVSASKLEGFGISVLEAMACNVPVILSKIAPFREITKNKAIFFDNEHDLSRIIKHYFNDREKYLKQVATQNDLLKEFDWGSIYQKWLK